MAGQTAAAPELTAALSAQHTPVPGQEGPFPAQMLSTQMDVKPVTRGR